MAFKVDDIRKFKKYPGTFEKKSDTQYDFHFAKSDKSKIYKIFDDTRAVKDGNTGSWKWEGNNFKIGNSTWKPETLQTLNDTHKSKDESKKKVDGKTQPETPKTAPEKPKAEIQPAVKVDYKSKTVPITCYPDTSPENFFKTHYKDEFLDKAAKRFLDYFIKRFGNVWDFGRIMDEQCDEKTLWAMYTGGLQKSPEGWRLHEMPAVNFLIKKNVMNNQTRGEVFFNEDKLKFPNEIKETVKETLTKKLKTIKEGKVMKNTIVEKLKKIKNNKKIDEVKMVRTLFKMNEDFEGRRYNKFYKSMGKFVVNSSLNESVDSTFKNAFSVVYAGLEGGFKEKYIDNLLSKLNVSTTSDIGKTIKDELMSTPDDKVVDVFFDCNAVSNVIVSAIAPTIISEFPTTTGDDLMGVVQNVLTQQIQSQNTKETLMVKISQIVCPILTNTMDNVTSLSQDMRNSVIPQILGSDDLV